MSFDVFISYAHQDKPIAYAACAIVEKTGIRCWIAPRDIAPGEEYAAALSEALESCKAFVLIFSGRANESPHIKREVERAVSRGVPLIPVRIEDIEPNAALKFFVSSVHWLDAMSPPMEQHFERLARTLQAILEKEGESVAARPGPMRRDETASTDPLLEATKARITRRARGSAVAAVEPRRRADAPGGAVPGHAQSAALCRRYGVVLFCSLSEYPGRFGDRKPCGDHNDGGGVLLSASQPDKFDMGIRRN